MDAEDDDHDEEEGENAGPRGFVSVLRQGEGGGQLEHQDQPHCLRHQGRGRGR